MFGGVSRCGQTSIKRRKVTTQLQSDAFGSPPIWSGTACKYLELATRYPSSHFRPKFRNNTLDITRYLFRKRCLETSGQNWSAGPHSWVDRYRIRKNKHLRKHYPLQPTPSHGLSQEPHLDAPSFRCPPRGVTLRPIIRCFGRSTRRLSFQRPTHRLPQSRTASATPNHPPSASALSLHTQKKNHGKQRLSATPYRPCKGADTRR